MKAPLPKLLKRLSDRGFCTKEGKPIAKSGWAFLDTEQIILLYSSVNRGIQNYYRFVDNWAHLQRIQYILHFSLAMTLGRKFNISTRHPFSNALGNASPPSAKTKRGKRKRRSHSLSITIGPRTGMPFKVEDTLILTSFGRRCT
jgi:hypothetical protein